MLTSSLGRLAHPVFDTKHSILDSKQVMVVSRGFLTCNLSFPLRLEATRISIRHDNLCHDGEKQVHGVMGPRLFAIDLPLVGRGSANGLHSKFQRAENDLLRGYSDGLRFPLMLPVLDEYIW